MNIDGFIKPVTHKLSVKAICYFAYPPKETSKFLSVLSVLSLLVLSLLSVLLQVVCINQSSIFDLKCI